MPTQIQEKAIPSSRGTCDFVGLAQTGTGTDGCSGLPDLELIDDAENYQALVLCPRELSLQIVGDPENFSEHFKNFNIVAVYGGASIGETDQKVGSVGRISWGHNPAGYWIWSIAKRWTWAMLNMVPDGRDEMRTWFQRRFWWISYTGDKKTWLFSATTPSTVKSIMKNYTDRPRRVNGGQQNKGNIKHRTFLWWFMSATNTSRFAYPRFQPEIFSVIFCRTRIDTQRRCRDTGEEDNYNAGFPFHRDLTQQQRDKRDEEFRQQGIQILVTDVAARGIDVEKHLARNPQRTFPMRMEFYTHRSGANSAGWERTGVLLPWCRHVRVSCVKQIEKNTEGAFHQNEKSQRDRKF